MLSVEFGSDATKLLRKADKKIARRFIKRIERLKVEPFPSDVKRVAGRKEKIFRVRVGYYRVQYSVYYDKNVLFVSDVGKRPKAYN